MDLDSVTLSVQRDIKFDLFYHFPYDLVKLQIGKFQFLKEMAAEEPAAIYVTFAALLSDTEQCPGPKSPWHAPDPPALGHRQYAPH